MRRLPFVLACLIFTLLCFVAPSHSKPAEDDSAAEVPKSTTFNGQTVPPLTQLKGTSYKDQISKGYWLVKAFSPYCIHCQHLAPKWQTLYEYYYTSKSPDEKQSFSDYYGLNFAELDCVAFGDVCVEIGVRSYPTLKLFKDGEEIKTMTSDKDLDKLSKFIEESLEIIVPGSRPPDGVKLPKVGDKEFDPKTIFPSLPSIQQHQLTTASNSPTTSKSPPVNPDGVSFPFESLESFHNLQKNTLDPWFIKFYDPSCPHCMRMASAWRGMALEMKGKLNVGEVNCVAHRDICKEMHISSYPTIKLLQGPETVDYQGSRGLGDFIQYANQAAEIGSGVKKVSAADFAALEKSQEVIFVYFYDHAATSEDMLAVERLPMALMGKARLVKSDDPALAQRFKVNSFPQLLVSRDGRPEIFEKLAPHEMRNVTLIEEWMKTVWLPLVPEITSANAHQLMDDKIVVLGILSRDRKEEFAVGRWELKRTATEWMDRKDQEKNLERNKLRHAKESRIEQAKNRGDRRALEREKLTRIDTDNLPGRQVAFAWVDGVFWERWIRTSFGLSVRTDGERIVINDHSARRYWDTTSTGNPITPSQLAILETLDLVIQTPPRIPPKVRGYRIVDWSILTSNQAAQHPWLATFTCIGSIVLFVMLFMKIRRRGRRTYGSHGGFLRLEEKIGMGDGVTSNGKVD